MDLVSVDRSVDIIGVVTVTAANQTNEAQENRHLGQRAALFRASVRGVRVDVVTQSLLNEFAASQKIDGLPLSDQFEAFANYIVVSDLYPEEFDVNLIATGEGEFGIDGIAVIVNDVIIEDEEQLEDIISHSVALQAQFVFVQSKTTSSFDSGDMSKFFKRCSTSSRRKLAFNRASVFLNFNV